MKIENIAHILRAARELTGEIVFCLIGSQAILVQFPDDPRIPQIMLQSNEIDLWPRDRPELAELIEGAMGNGSAFQRLYGYHADGVGPQTAILPASWMNRSVRLEGHPSLGGAVALCPELHDLAVSKLAAFRDKDLEWVQAGIDAGLVCAATLVKRIAEVPDQLDFPADRRAAISSWAEARIGENDDCRPR